MARNYPLSSKYKNSEYYLIFSYFTKIGPNKMQQLEAYFPDLAEILKASTVELEKAGLEPKLATEFTCWKQTFSLENALQELRQEKINFVTWHDKNYPKQLLEIASPPYIIYYKGSFDGKIINRLAVVGSRQHSTYATEACKSILPAVISAGVEIASGLALGIDSLAHQAALNNNGRTVAVLGSGLRTPNIYPPQNRLLAERIIKSGGAIISEFPPSAPPCKINFPRRNRIISGLAQATLVIEAPLKSGALITARYALDQNREVLAIPGDIFSNFSKGTNHLIQAGAKMILSPDDVLEVFGIAPN